MKSEWKTIRADEFCSLVTDGTHDSPKPQAAGRKLITSKHLKGYYLDFESANWISSEDYEKVIARSSVEQWDILYSMIGTIGNVYLEKNPVVDYACKNVGIFKFGGNCNKAYWMYYYLKSPQAMEFIKAHLRGTTQLYVPLATLREMPVPVPDEEEMNKIVAILRTLDDKIQCSIKINDNLEQQAQTLFKSWFVDFEPFDESFIDSPIGTKIPRSLQMVQIGSLPHILETGKRPKGGAVATGAPSIGAENVKRLGEVNFASAKYIPVEFAQKMDKGKVHGYELMLYKDGGKPGTFIPHFSMFGEGFPYDDFFINEHVFKLDFGDKGFNEFCYFYLQTDYPYNWLANNGGKAAVPGINQQDVNSIWIYHPDNPLVKEYCKWVQPIFTTILKNCLQNVKLSQLRDALLPKLMSGELDVSNIEI